MLNWDFLECGQLECGQRPDRGCTGGSRPALGMFPGVGLFCVRASSIRPLLMLLAYAVERDWLIAADNPAHSICLTDAGHVWTARLLK
jgi:hypothetical protein